MRIIKSKGTQILRAGWYCLQRYWCTLVSELPTHPREAGLENKLWKHTGAGRAGDQPWGGRCWSVALQSHTRASCAPECTCLQADISVCVSLVRNLCEHMLPWRCFEIKTACCSLEFRGLSGSQRGSSFAERVGRTPEKVSRGCRRKDV